jgi:hypothetical protein
MTAPARTATGTRHPRTGEKKLKAQSSKLKKSTKLKIPTAAWKALAASAA